MAPPHLVNGGTFARALLAQIYLEFFPGAAQLVIAILAADRSGQIELKVGRFKKDIAEQKAAEMGESADAGVYLEGTEECDHSDDQHEPLHLHGKDEAEEDGTVREQHGAGHQDAKNSSRAADGAHGG